MGQMGPIGVWFKIPIFLQPRFPTTFEHEHLRELRFLAQAAGRFPAGVTTQAAAIDDDLFSRRPRRQNCGNNSFHRSSFNESAPGT